MELATAENAYAAFLLDKGLQGIIGD